MRKIGDKVIMVGETLKANRHYETGVGRVTDDLGNGYFNVMWHFNGVASHTTINHARDLRTFVRASTAELR